MAYYYMSPRVYTAHCRLFDIILHNLLVYNRVDDEYRILKNCGVTVLSSSKLKYAHKIPVCSLGQTKSDKAAPMEIHFNTPCGAG